METSCKASTELDKELMKYKFFSSGLLVVLIAMVVSFLSSKYPSSSPLSTLELEKACAALKEDNEGGDNSSDSMHYGNAIIASVFIVYVSYNIVKVTYSFVCNEIEVWVSTRKSNPTFDWVEYFFYRIDYLYSHEDKFVLVMLTMCTLILIITGGGAWWLATDDTIAESLWSAWTFVADPGTHADQIGMASRLISLILSMGGMIIFAIVIGMIHSNITVFVENLRSGKSRVILSNHTLILGEGDKLIPIIQELAMANESEGGGSIVILSQKDKEELEETLAASCIDLRGSDIVVRTGVPYFSSDLLKVSPHTARSIIILLDYSQNPDIIDVLTVRTLLCLKGMKTPIKGHIVADVFDIDNEGLVQIAGKGLDVETFVSTDIIGRLMIQCAREKGLSHVLEELLGFDGCEFYMKQWNELTGLTFGEVMFRFDTAIPVGILREKTDKENLLCDADSTSKEMILNPDVDTVVMEGDSIVVISEDDDTYSASTICLFKKDCSCEQSPTTGCCSTAQSKLSLREKIGTEYKPREKFKEKLLFIGMRRDMGDMITALDDYLCPGSHLTLFNQVPLEHREERLTQGYRHVNPINVEIHHVYGNQTIRKDLELLKLEEFDSILILADEDTAAHAGASFDMTQADSRSLTSLLLIRDIQKQRRQQLQRQSSSDESAVHMVGKINTCALISEILDVRTKPLVSIDASKTTDYVSSNSMLSMAIAMVSEQQEVNLILKELLTAEGNELYIVPVSSYLKEGVVASFNEVAAICKLGPNHLVMGYKIHGKTYLNPTDKSKPINWSDDESAELIVMAADLE